MPHANPEWTEADHAAVHGAARTPPTADGPRTPKEAALERLAELRNQLAGAGADEPAAAPPADLTPEELEAPF